MRYFCKLAYNGTKYSGWQRQPNSITVQQIVEENFATCLRSKTQVVGCGRTDAGVHASVYYLHFEVEEALPENFLYRLNKMLPEDIVLFEVFECEKHARFDAYQRSYFYQLISKKDPFRKETAWFYPQFKSLNLDKMNEAAALLLNYKSFFPFCKTNSDVKTMDCDLTRCEWLQNDSKDELIFHITANRFLRGMVRLIVGMTVNVGLGKVSIETVKEALDKQIHLEKSYSVPPHGLFLSEVLYDFETPKF